MGAPRFRRDGGHGASGLWNIDLARSARESLPPLDYVQGPYYAIWTKALQNMLIERGLISEQELAQGQAITPPRAGRAGAQSRRRGRGPWPKAARPTGPAPKRRALPWASVCGP